MSQRCPNGNEALTLQDMLRIALSNSESLTQTNIAILYSVVQAILKKLNCEDDIVTLTGVKSKELQELLSSANRCPLRIDDRIIVLTEKLDKMEQIEQEIEKMETKLNKHLEIKFEKHAEESLTEEESITSSKIVPTLQLEKVLRRKTTSGSGTSLHDGTQKQTDLKPSTVGTFEAEAKSLIDNANFLSNKANELKESFSAFKRRIEDNDGWYDKDENAIKESFSAFKRRIEDNEGWWELSSSCEEANAVVVLSPMLNQMIQTKQLAVKPTNQLKDEGKVEELDAETEATETSKEPKDAYCCYMPCEDVFTIPSPEYELPRALLKSSVFMNGVQEFARAPLMRRISKIENNFWTLFENMFKAIAEAKNRIHEKSAYDHAFSKLTQLCYVVTGNHFVFKDTLAGMQEIFDLKFDKCEIIPIKNEFSEMLHRLTCETKNVYHQNTQPKAAGFVFQTEGEKLVSKALTKLVPRPKKCSPHCESEFCEGNAREVQLLQRIDQLTLNYLSRIQELQSKPNKLIRLTNAKTFLREIKKLRRLPSFEITSDDQIINLV